MLSEIATSPHDEEPMEHPLVQDRLDELRAEFYVLAINWDHVRENSRTGERISPAHACICPNCSNKTDALLYSEQDCEAVFFCDGCFDSAHEDEIREKLTEEFARDFS
jgi:phosphoglycerate dehydrogenase-like enzyme